ncbi:tetratricopeptide repeat protein [Prosthecomicrobium sp. N25]|uniref:tetratricopeptide repeat protein n=1 Tax=Prosthecomicrobium sp. N25 TaxID=3129254 RepID=UPI0030789011
MFSLARLGAVVLAFQISSAGAATTTVNVEMECGKLAASPDEPNKPTQGVVEIDASLSSAAIAVCEEAARKDPWNPIPTYRLARAYTADGPKQDVGYALQLYRQVWGTAKRAQDQLGPDRAEWYRAMAQKSLTPSHYQAAAESGHVISQMSLAYLYLDTRFQVHDPALADTWMKKAATSGYAPAQIAYGSLLESRNQHDEAVKWYRLAAAQDFAPAYSRIGLLHKNGKGVEKDGKKALEYVAKAARMGYADSQVLLGDLIMQGVGMPPNRQLARQWYKKSAEAGNQIAVHRLKATEPKGEISHALMAAGLLTLGLMILLPDDPEVAKKYNNRRTECSYPWFHITDNMCKNTETGDVLVVN